jgi:hypothetical protein
MKGGDCGNRSPAVASDVLRPMRECRPGRFERKAAPVEHAGNGVEANRPEADHHHNPIEGIELFEQVGKAVL